MKTVFSKKSLIAVVAIASTSVFAQTPETTVTPDVDTAEINAQFRADLTARKWQQEPKVQAAKDKYNLVGATELAGTTLLLGGGVIASLAEDAGKLNPIQKGANLTISPSLIADIDAPAKKGDRITVTTQGPAERNKKAQEKAKTFIQGAASSGENEVAKGLKELAANNHRLTGLKIEKRGSRLLGRAGTLGLLGGTALGIYSIADTHEMAQNIRTEETRLKAINTQIEALDREELEVQNTDH